MPPWDMTQAQIGWSLKSGLHRLQEAMEVSVQGVCVCVYVNVSSPLFSKTELNVLFSAWHFYSLQTSDPFIVHLSASTRPSITLTSLQAAGLVGPREPWPTVDPIYIHTGSPPTHVPELDEAPGLLDAHWCV